MEQSAWRKALKTKLKESRLLRAMRLVFELHVFCVLNSTTPGLPNSLFSFAITSRFLPIFKVI